MRYLFQLSDKIIIELTTKSIPSLFLKHFHILIKQDSVANLLPWCVSANLPGTHHPPHTQWKAWPMAFRRDIFKWSAWAVPLHRVSVPAALPSGQRQPCPSPAQSHDLESEHCSCRASSREGEKAAPCLLGGFQLSPPPEACAAMHASS